MAKGGYRGGMPMMGGMSEAPAQADAETAPEKSAP
mgnify:CR=1 FL=1